MGGTSGNGTAFKITPSGTFMVLHSFSAVSLMGRVDNVNSDGANPEGSLVQDTNGNLFSATVFGGTNGNGEIFKITPSGTSTPEVSFFPLSDSFHRGAHPSVGLFHDRNSNFPSFYGTTNQGGTGGSGTVFVFIPVA